MSKAVFISKTNDGTGSTRRGNKSRILDIGQLLS
jgi:hypothetical protein